MRYNVPSPLRRLFTASLLTLAALPAAALELGEVAFQQAMKDLANDFRMMCVAAHPDDEDGATLAYYRMMHGVKTYAVIATRGEGGQNEIGPELYNELGVIRTREMKAAAEVEGAELYFLDLPEFGFSKSPEETYEKWNRENALERMVRAIRKTRPHVIITHHGRMKDHGHHQAIGAILIEAFDVAADPARFPDHAAQGLAPWQASRLYIRDFKGGEGMVVTDITTLEPLRGKTIAEIAAHALELHESQGMKQFIDLLLSSDHRSYYRLIKTTSQKDAKGPAAGPEYGGLFAGLPLPLTPLALPASNRAEARAALTAWLGANTAAKDGTPDERARWREANRAAVIAADLRLTAKTRDRSVVPGQKIDLEVSLADHGAADARNAELELAHLGGLGEIGTHRLQIPFQTAPAGRGTFSFTIPADAKRTLPLAPRLFEPDFLAPQLELRARVDCGEATLELAEPVYLDVAAPLTVTFPDGPVLVRAGDTTPVDVTLRVANNEPEAYTEYLTLAAPDGWRVEPERMAVSLGKEGEQRLLSVQLIPDAAPAPGRHALRAQVPGANAPEELAIHVVEVKTAEGRNIGLIDAYDTTMAATLTRLGLSWARIGEGDFRPDALDRFDTIIADMRVYQYRPDLTANNPALLDFVHRGGTFIVLYQKTFDWNPDFAPSPITLSSNRVTREDAPVTLLVADHPLFTTPNAIQPGDWDGWLQERGLYFPESWGTAYTPLLAMSDPGEEIPPGSLLVMEHGQGKYVYTALGWYRQLRELHPGALRCFANLLAW